MTAPAFARRRSLVLLAGGLCAATAGGIVAPAAALAGDSRRERDHERARAAMERGEALPLADILARVRSNLGGEVVGVDFERDGGRWIYEFKVIGPAGRLAKVHVDAATAQVLRREAE